ASREDVGDVAHRTCDVEREDDADRFRMRRAVAALSCANAEWRHERMHGLRREDLLFRFVASRARARGVRVVAVVAEPHVNPTRPFGNGDNAAARTLRTPPHRAGLSRPTRRSSATRFAPARALRSTAVRFAFRARTRSRERSLRCLARSPR